MRVGERHRMGNPAGSRELAGRGMVDPGHCLPVFLLVSTRNGSILECTARAMSAEKRGRYSSMARSGGEVV
jgi:hypothetical protein